MKMIDADTLIRERTKREIDDHADADQMMRDGMSTEAAAVAQSETTASRRGDGFVEVASGAATGLRIDRGSNRVDLRAPARNTSKRAPGRAD